MLKPVVGMRHPTLVRLIRWWEEKRGERPMPSRVDLDPTELPDILPDLLLLTVELERSYAFTCRLAGTRVESWLGGSLRGKRAEEISFGSPETSLIEQYHRTAQDGEPTLCEESYSVGQARVRYERLLVPLSGTATAVGHLLGAAVFHETKAARAEAALSRRALPRGR